MGSNGAAGGQRKGAEQSCRFAFFNARNPETARPVPTSPPPHPNHQYVARKFAQERTAKLKKVMTPSATRSLFLRKVIRRVRKFGDQQFRGDCVAVILKEALMRQDPNGTGSLAPYQPDKTNRA